MKKSLKLGKREELGSEFEHNFEGSIESIIERLQNKKQYFEGMGYTDISMDCRQSWDYDDCSTEFVYYGRKQLSAKDLIEGKDTCVKSN